MTRLFPACRWVVTAVLAGGIASEAKAEESHSASLQESTSPPAVTKKISVRPLSPVAYFRELLAMSPAQRQVSLAGQSFEQKRVLLAKLREYEALPSGVREARLRETQLHWYLLELMKTPTAQRTSRLVLIPAEDRDFVAERLHQWDKLSVESQKQFLENQNVIELWMRFQSSSPDEQQRLLNGFSTDRRKKIEEELARWQALPNEQKQSMVDAFRMFFELNGQQQSNTLSALSESERQQMEATLKEFAQLSSELRRQCIDSFKQFANMPVEQRREFLRNAARWDAMSPGERKLWRELVRNLPAMPPMPPGFDPDAPPLPPMPPAFPLRREDVPITNLAR